jgi:hypothetical protein
LGGATFRDAAESLRGFEQSVHQTSEGLFEQTAVLLNQQSALSQVDAFFDRVVNRARQAGSETQSFAERFREGFKQLFKGFSGEGFAQLADAAEKTVKEIESPLDKFQEKLASVRQQFSAGLLDENQFALATQKAVAELRDATGLGEVKLSGAAVAGSAEAVSAINRFQAGAAEPRRVEELLKQAKEIQRQQLEEAKRTREAIERLAEVGGGSDL